MGKWIASATLISALFIVRSNSMALPVDLGTAGPDNWSVLEVGNGAVVEQVDLSNPQGGISGNVGIQQNGKIQGSGPPITGDLYLGDSASAQFSGTYVNNAPVTGVVHLGSNATVSPNSYSFTTVSDSPQTLLSQARTDAINASAAAHALTPTSALTQINLSHTTMTLAPGVYNLTGFQLDHTTLTLSGAGSFVFNISSVFTLSSGKVLLAGGATEQNVLFNYTGTSNVAFSGGGNDSELHGIILALNAPIQLSPGLVVGEVISGQNISIVSGAIVEGVPGGGGGGEGGRPVPDEASTLVLMSLGLGALLILNQLASPAKSVGRLPRLF
jgi:hypothetical protein